MATSEWRRAFSRCSVGIEVARTCETSHYRAGPEGHFQSEQNGIFYDAQLKRTLALIRDKCQGGKWYKDRAVVIMLQC
jgi:hypothetical protein